MKRPVWLPSLILVFQAFSAAWAVENYADRPRIQDIEPKEVPSSSRPAGWSKVKNATVRFLGEMLALYPNDDLYFLARDGEYLYDAAQALLSDRPEDLKRIHLLNVSRKNVDDPKMMAYIAQEGINKEALSNRRAILVDTGFEGSIWTKIRKTAPKALKDKILCHLISSSNVEIPSSRVYLEQLSKSKISDLDAFFDTVEEYEDLPHFTQTSDHYGKKGGRIVPLSSADQEPAVRDHSIRLMQDYRDYFSKNEVKKEFYAISAKMNQFLSEVRNASPDYEKLKTLAQDLSARGVDLFVTDVADAAAKDLVPLSVPKMDLLATIAGEQKKYPKIAKETAIEAIAERYLRDESGKQVHELSIDSTNRDAIIHTLLDEDFYDEYTPVQRDRLIRQLVADKDVRDSIGLDELYKRYKRAKIPKEDLLDIFGQEFLFSDRTFPKLYFLMNEDRFDGPLRHRYLEIQKRIQARLNPESASLEKIDRTTDKKNRYAGKKFEKGAKIKTPFGRQFEVIEYIDSGDRGAVYKVKGKDGKIFAFKVAVDSEWDTLDSFRRELVKYEGLVKLDAPRARIFEHGPDYVVKEWVEGERGDDWVHHWKREGAPLSEKQVKGLRKLFTSFADRGAYVADLKSDNVIWDGKKWVIVDPGDVFFGLDRQEVLRRYDEKVRDEWTRSLVKSCGTLFKAVAY